MNRPDEMGFTVQVGHWFCLTCFMHFISLCHSMQGEAYGRGEKGGRHSTTLPKDNFPAGRVGEVLSAIQYTVKTYDESESNLLPLLDVFVHLGVTFIGRAYILCCFFYRCNVREMIM